MKEQSRAIDLHAVGIRPTRQRTTIIRAIKDNGSRHLTAESLHKELAANGSRISLATIYNTLHDFTSAGLVRRVEVGERTWFCTNGHPHHHFYDEATGRLHDIHDANLLVGDLPEPPEGMEITSVDVVIRVRPLRG